jgi:hypothetical protein
MVVLDDGTTSNLYPWADVLMLLFALQESSGDVARAVVQTARELRFLSFASLEYDGNIYMTPQDFLESVTDEAPRGEFLLFLSLRIVKLHIWQCISLA